MQNMANHLHFFYTEDKGRRESLQSVVIHAISVASLEY